MKTLILYKSIHHNNTKKIAEVLASELGADLLDIDRAKAEDLEKYELVGFGSGIYFGQPHRCLFNLLDKLPQQNSKPVFIFITSGLLKIKFIYEFDKKLKEKLIAKGFEIIGEFNCRGWDTYPIFVKPFNGINKGRPNQKDLEQAKDFALIIKNSIV